MKLIKDGIVKEVDNRGLVADYVSAGWKLVEDKKDESKPKVDKKNEDDRI